MITEVIMYVVKCDNCGEEHEGSHYSAYSDDGFAREEADGDDWQTDLDDKDYCPKCFLNYSDDDDGEKVILDESRKKENVKADIYKQITESL